MKTQKCKICKKEISILGWPNHVNMHKRQLGINCFRQRNELLIIANMGILGKVNSGMSAANVNLNRYFIKNEVKGNGTGS